MKEYLATVESRIEVTQGTWVLDLECPELGASAAPGQFVLAHGRAVNNLGDYPYLRYALPIHRLTPRGLAVWIRPTTPALARLATRRVGETLDLLGPGGRGADLPSPNGTLSLIAQGLSLGPLLSILDRTPCAAQIVTLAPTAAQVYPRELLPRHVAYAPYVGHEEQAAFWRAVAEACAWGQRLYAAGTMPFYRSLREVLGATRLGHAGTAQVWLEGEIVCGQGHCGGCVVETRRGWRRICTDGPFFDLADLLLD